MKQIKRMAVLLTAAAFLLLTPVSALAARQEYVPTKAVFLELEDGKWVPSYEETYTYTKNGRIKSYTYKSLTSSFTDKITYTWKGNYLKKLENPSHTTTYSYKKKKLKSSANVSKASGTTTSSVSWKKRKGTLTSTDCYTGTITVNKRNQMINYTRIDSGGKKYTRKVKYFSNGNLKSDSYTGPDYFMNYKYNRKGYPISYKSDLSEVTYKYKKNKKGQITEQLITSKAKGGRVSYYKEVFSNWKKISRSVRNCDAFGNTVYTPYSD